jgi:Ni/Co efflux regulator RcnB
MIIKSMSMAVAAAALAMCMAAGSAFAQDRGHDRGHDRGDDRGNGRYEQKHREFDRHDNRRSDRYSREDYRPGRQFDRRGYPQPHAEWRRGGRVPNEYRGRNYVVNDYRAYQLQAPPRGYQWVGVGGDYVLAAIATGLIAQIIVGNQ